MELTFTGCIKDVEFGTYSHTYKIVRKGKCRYVNEDNFNSYDIFKRGTMVEVYHFSRPFSDCLLSVKKLGRVREERYWK